MAEKYVSPVTGTWARKSSSPFGARRGSKNRKHAGNDLQAANGSDAVAVVGGTVQYAGHNKGYQWNAVVMGDDGYAYRYATHGPLSVKVGDRIKQGQPVGKIARSHLHFEVIPPTSPAYQAMKASPGQFVSTQWYGKGTPVTIDPASFLGVKSGAKIAMGAPIGGAPRQIVALTPNDPFGVFGFKSGKAVTIASKELDEIATGIAKSAGVPTSVASPVPNALTQPIASAKMQRLPEGLPTIAATNAKPVEDTPAKTIAAETAKTTPLDALALVDDSPAALTGTTLAGMVGASPAGTVPPTAAGKTPAMRATIAEVARQREQEAIEQEQAFNRQDAEALQGAAIAAANREKKVLREIEVARQAAADQRDLDASALQPTANISQGAGSSTSERGTPFTISSGRRTDPLTGLQEGSGARVGASASGRANVDFGNRSGITIAARGSAGVGSSGSAVSRLSREALIRTGSDRSAPISARGEAGVGTGPGVADARPATTTPQMAAARRNLAMTAPQPASVSVSDKVRAAGADAAQAAVREKAEARFLDDTIKGLQTPEPIEWRPQAQPPALELTAPVRTIANVNAAAANAARILRERRETIASGFQATGPAGGFRVSDADRVSAGSLATYGRRQSDGSVRGTTSSGAGYVSRDGGNVIETKSGTYVKKKSGGGYAKSTVLCTYFKDKGWLSREIWAADSRYGLSKSDTMRRGYYFWAIPTIERMRRQDWIAKALERVLWPLASAWAHEAAYLDGTLPTGTLGGKMARLVLEPSAYLIGLAVTRRQAKPA